MISDSGKSSDLYKLLYNPKYSLYSWKMASPEEKRHLITEYKNELETILGVYLDDVIFYSGGRYSDCYGYYDSSSYAIAINEEYIDNLNPASSYHLFSTVRHEMRHAYQYAAIVGMDIYGYESAYHEDYCTLKIWYCNIMDYKSPKEDFLAYRNQPIEVDARRFAGQN